MLNSRGYICISSSSVVIHRSLFPGFGLNFGSVKEDNMLLLVVVCMLIIGNCDLPHGITWVRWSEEQL